MLSQTLASDLLAYMARHKCQPGDQLPTLTELSAELGISVNKLREQLEVARSLGLVDVRPRAGIRVKPYSFQPAVCLSLGYALAMDRANFRAFGDLRISIETGFWREAVSRLQPADHDHLRDLIQTAWRKLADTPVRIPHPEHRDFHLTIFSRLDNPFARAMLESYWEAYESVEYHVYADIEYLRKVWTYHEQIANLIFEGDIEGSLVTFIEHTRLVRYLNSPGSEHPVVVEFSGVIGVPQVENGTPEGSGTTAALDAATGLNGAAAQDVTVLPDSYESVE
ncbi:MAG: FadR family transcriptional regulator [Anaerolineae bacterium]|nr:FadR family transcriptional regulator [Anaerolineae bacterium]